MAKPKTTMGQRVAAMIFNGLCFVDDRLYMFPEFLHNKPVDRLFEGDVKAENFNDDALGRCLDSIYAYGPTKLFSEVAFEIGIEQGLLGRTFNIDTTSLTVYGDYEEEEGTPLREKNLMMNIAFSFLKRKNLSWSFTPNRLSLVVRSLTAGIASGTS